MVNGIINIMLRAVNALIVNSMINIMIKAKDISISYIFTMMDNDY